MTIPQANSTVIAMRKKIRRLTNSTGANSLTDDEIDEQINSIYTEDFAYGVKTDQMRAVYTFYTTPNRDRYPLDINYNQGMRAPVYFDGIQGSFYKDRTQFFNLWPRIPTQFIQSPTSLSGTITGIAQPTNPAEITSVSHGLETGAVIVISGVGGMTQLNGNTYTITKIDDNTFSLDGVDNTAFGAYTTGGSWAANSQSFEFTIQGPFLSREVMIGGVGANESAITIKDDGNGNLFYISPNPVTSDPPADTNPALPGMYNVNLGNPGLYNPTDIGTVDYVSGVFSFTLPGGVSLAAGKTFTVRVSQYQTGKPYSLLYWNNEFTVRPVPDKIHKIEIESYMTPVQFMQANDHPIVNQWWKFLSYLVSAEIQRERNDFEAVAMLQEGAKRQEELVLERQGVEELFQPTYTLFNATVPNPYLNNFWGMGFY